MVTPALCELTQPQPCGLQGPWSSQPHSGFILQGSNRCGSSQALLGFCAPGSTETPLTGRGLQPSYSHRAEQGTPGQRPAIPSDKRQVDSSTCCCGAEGPSLGTPQFQMVTGHLQDLVFMAVKDPEDPRAAEAMWLQPISREPKASLLESGRVSGSRLGEEEGRAGLPRPEPQPGWLQGQTCGER